LVVGLLGLLVAGGLYAFNNLIYDGIIVRTLQWLSVFTRFDYLSKGIFNVSDVVYYLSFTVLFIYLSVNAIEKRRWR